MMVETGGWIEEVASRFKFGDPSHHTVASMARSCVGRPNIVIVKTPLDINFPILHCDTCANDDGIRITDFLETRSTQPILVMGCQGDGQAMLLCVQGRQATPECPWPKNDG